MIKFIFGIVLALHGMVHLLYVGQSQRLFELQPGMVWPDGSWALSRMAGTEGTRLLATGLLAVGAILFVAGGSGLIFGQDWWRSLVRIAAIYSSLIYLLLWDGGVQNLANKGAIGILINVVILVISLSGFVSF